MANNNSLSAQALADARELRRVAEANARLSLMETFQPTLQRMVTNKLREEDDDFAGEDPEGFDIDISVSPDEMGGEEPTEIENGGGEDIGLGSFDEGGGEEEMPAEEGDETDMEYESLLRELEGMEEEDPEMMDEGEEENWQDPIEEGEDMGGEEDIVERLLREFSEMDDESEDTEMFTESEDDGGAYTDTPPNPQYNSESRQLHRENARLKKELNEALKANVTYKRTINEVNLLNAKLMYTTKALRTENLTQAQQLRILETFDRAQSVREVKLVYSTIVEALNKRKPASQKRQVQEGLASKATKAINPSKRQLTEGNGKPRDVVRWQQLAGLAQIDY